MQAVRDMGDEEFMVHMEQSHPDSMRMEFQAEPDRAARRLRAPHEWRTFHDTLHRLHLNEIPHDHEEAGVEYDRDTKLKFHEKQEKVWVVQQTGSGNLGVVGVTTSELVTPDVPGLDKTKTFTSTSTILYRPSLAPIYGGPTLLEALWSEMDRLMEGLMTKADAEDGGDKFRAAELAWVLAIVTNAYNPSVDSIRAEAVDRWNAQQEGE